MIHNIPNRKPKSQEQKPHQKLGMNTGASDGLVVPATILSKQYLNTEQTF